MSKNQSFTGINYKYTIPVPGVKYPVDPPYTPEQYEESWRQTKLLMKRLQLLARGIDK